MSEEVSSSKGFSKIIPTKPETVFKRTLRGSCVPQKNVLLGTIYGR